MSTLIKNLKFMYPFMVKNYKYTVMLLFNLAEPDWISVPCNQKLLFHYFCYMPKVEAFSHLQNVQYYCSPDYILIQNTCTAFFWYENLNLLKNVYKIFKTKTMPLNKITITILKQIIDPLPLTFDFPKFLFHKNANTTNVINLQRS